MQKLLRLALKSTDIATAAILVAFFNVFLSGYDFPWTVNAIPIPDSATKLTLSVRRAHPMVAEYDYKISVKLPDGRELTQDLTPQTGGQAMLNVDYFPQENAPGKGYVRFDLVDVPPQNRIPQYLNVTSGILEAPQNVNIAQARPLGFIGFDMAYHVSSNWERLHSLSLLELSRRNFTQAFDFETKALGVARTQSDRDLAATSLHYLARILKQSKGDNDEIEKFYKDALSVAPATAKKREDKIEVTSKSMVAFELANFYSENGRFEQARKKMDSVLDFLKGPMAKTLSTSELGKTLDDVKVAYARLELKAGNKAKASDLVASLTSKNIKNDSEMKMIWGDLYPNAIVIEFDILNSLHLNPDGRPVAGTASFDIMPSGEIGKLNILTTTGDRNECEYVIAYSVYGSSPILTKTPFLVKKPIRCLVSIDCKPNDFHVALTSPDRRGNWLNVLGWPAWLGIFGILGLLAWLGWRWSRILK